MDEKMFMYAKWKLWKKESQTNKQPHIGREMKTTVTHLVKKCICISRKWASCCCAKEYSSVPGGAIDGNGVTVHKFLDWITLYNSVENSWFGGCQTYQLTSLFCLGFFNTNTWKTTSNDPWCELGLWFPAGRIWSDSFTHEKDHGFILTVRSSRVKPSWIHWERQHRFL